MQIAENEKWQHGDWEYNWNANGSLRSVKLPNGEIVSYEYDALGRRTKKIFNNKIIRYLWDNNVLLHEWEYNANEQPRKIINKLGEISFNKPEPINNLITWIYETGSFVPCAKIINNEAFSIINDYIGRPILAFDKNGEQIWSCDYDIYGNLRNLKGDKSFIPFKQLGQYEDVETGLYYNRFRYYDPNTGLYISKDPIGLLGGFALYGYVKDVNSWVDVFGLSKKIIVDTTKALPDVMNRGLHVNVVQGKTKIHIGIQANKIDEKIVGIKLVSADPTAKKIKISNKMEKAIMDYIKENSEKLSDTAKNAAKNFTGNDVNMKNNLEEVADALKNGCY